MVRQVPPPKDAAKYPITAGVAVLAIAASLAFWSKWSIEPLVMTSLTFPQHPWTALTSVFPHVTVYHLAFNAYWLWVFGTLVEGVFGHAKFLGIVLLLAVGSSMAEFAFLQGGVGLSGVGYGLFGMLLVLSRRDPRFAGTLRQQIIFLFIGWFFLCIVLTVTGIMPIGNIAHGSGAVLGAGLGWIVVKPRGQRLAAKAAFSGVMLIILACATVARPAVNFSKEAPLEYEFVAIQNLERGHNQEALKLLQEAVRYRRAGAETWYNLGVAYDRCKDLKGELACFQQAVQMDPKPQYEKAYRDLTEYLKEIEAGAATAPATRGGG
jgi:membrane associated rhomboid family serine protease